MPLHHFTMESSFISGLIGIGLTKYKSASEEVASRGLHVDKEVGIGNHVARRAMVTPREDQPHLIGTDQGRKARTREASRRAQSWHGQHRCIGRGAVVQRTAAPQTPPPAAELPQSAHVRNLDGT